MSARSVAKETAARYVAACAPWANRWRLKTARPNIAANWKRHHAMIAVARDGGGERSVQAEGDSETDALDALTAKLRDLAAKGEQLTEHVTVPGGYASWDAWARAQFPAAYGLPTETEGDDLRALGLRAMPTADELTAAWRETAQRTHPDVGGSDAAFVHARAAYERLRGVMA